WLLTHGMKLVIAKCLNSPEYLSTLGTTVNKAIEKGMQDGLAVGIIHGREGRVLIDLKANKDASIEAVMNILRYEEHLAASMEGTSGATPATADLTTALSVTLASVGTVTPLFRR
nr:cold-regulated 47 [Tanacetum cinerariifolium]